MVFPLKETCTVYRELDGVERLEFLPQPGILADFQINQALEVLRKKVLKIGKDLVGDLWLSTSSPSTTGNVTLSGAGAQIYVNTGDLYVQGKYFRIGTQVTIGAHYTSGVSVLYGKVRTLRKTLDDYPSDVSLNISGMGGVYSGANLYVVDLTFTYLTGSTTLPTPSTGTWDPNSGLFTFSAIPAILTASDVLNNYVVELFNSTGVSLGRFVIRDSTLAGATTSTILFTDYANNPVVFSPPITGGASSTALPTSVSFYEYVRIADFSLAGVVSNFLPIKSATINLASYLDGVDTAQINDDAVTSAKILDATIVTGNLSASAGILGTQLANATVDTTQLKDSSVTTAKILDANVTTAKIADANITTVKILDANVTLAKLASSSVDSSKIVDGSIVDADINASAAIADTKLAVSYLKTDGTRNLTGDLLTSSNIKIDGVDLSAMIVPLFFQSNVKVGSTGAVSPVEFTIEQGTVKNIVCVGVQILGGWVSIKARFDAKCGSGGGTNATLAATGTSVSTGNFTASYVAYTLTLAVSAITPDASGYTTIILSYSDAGAATVGGIRNVRIYATYA
jgi:hypothetical protein